MPNAWLHALVAVPMYAPRHALSIGECRLQRRRQLPAGEQCLRRLVTLPQVLRAQRRQLLLQMSLARAQLDLPRDRRDGRPNPAPALALEGDQEVGPLPGALLEERRNALVDPLTADLDQLDQGGAAHGGLDAHGRNVTELSILRGFQGDRIRVLIVEGSTESDPGLKESEHLRALLEMAKAEGLEGDRVAVHAFLDGRDTPPRSAQQYIAALEGWMSELGVGRIARRRLGLDPFAAQLGRRHATSSRRRFA